MLLIRGLRPDALRQFNLKPDNQHIVIQRLRSLDQALTLANTDTKIYDYLQTKEGVSVLRQTLEPLNEWRKLIPGPLPEVETFDEYIELYKRNYISPYLFEVTADWLNIVHKFRDYETLQLIIQFHKFDLSTNDIAVIRANLKAYPLSNFFQIWELVGRQDDLLSVLEYKNLSIIEKEKRLLPLLDVISKEITLLERFLESSLRNLPTFFLALYKRNEKLGLAVLSRDILISKQTTLVELRRIEQSLFLVLDKEEAIRSVREFAEKLMITRMAEEYTHREREIAWEFLFNYRSDLILRRMMEKETDDNRLWLQEKMKTV